MKRYIKYAQVFIQQYRHARRFHYGCTRRQAWHYARETVVFGDDVYSVPF